MQSFNRSNLKTSASFSDSVDDLKTTGIVLGHWMYSVALLQTSNKEEMKATVQIIWTLNTTSFGAIVLRRNEKKVNLSETCHRPSFLHSNFTRTPTVDLSDVIKDPS